MIWASTYLDITCCQNNNSWGDGATGRMRPSPPCSVLYDLRQGRDAALHFAADYCVD